MKKYNWKAVNKARACVQEEGHIIITTNAGLYRDEYHYLRGPVGQEQWCCNYSDPLSQGNNSDCP